MTAPLYDVKNKLSEYVKIAEQGEPVRISKHGQETVVLVRTQDYVEPSEKSVDIFTKVHERWLKNRRCKDDFDDVWAYLANERTKLFPERPNPWL